MWQSNTTPNASANFVFGHELSVYDKFIIIILLHCGILGPVSSTRILTKAIPGRSLFPSVGRRTWQSPSDTTQRLIEIGRAGGPKGPPLHGGKIKCRGGSSDPPEKLSETGMRYYLRFLLHQAKLTFLPLWFLFFLFTFSTKVFRSTGGLLLTESHFLYFLYFETVLYHPFRHRATCVRGKRPRLRQEGQESGLFLSLVGRNKRMAFSFKIRDVIFRCSDFLYPTVFYTQIR